MICCHGLQVYRRTSENKINSQQAARAAYSCQGTLYGAFTMLMLVSICLGVGALISCVLWMGEFIERYYKYARAIDKIRGDLFER